MYNTRHQFISFLKKPQYVHKLLLHFFGYYSNFLKKIRAFALFKQNHTMCE